MVEYLTQQQIGRLRELATAPRDRLLIEVQYQTGCTVSELVEIKREDIGNTSITVANRRCHVSPQLIADINDFLRTHESPYLFCSRQSPQLTPKRVQQIVKHYLQQLHADLEKKTPHALRYTHIAHALKQRIPIKDIMRQTGLRQLRMAQLVEELGPQDGGYGGMLP